MRFEIKNKSYASSIMYRVCKGLNISENDIKSGSRIAKVVEARALICKLLRDGEECYESIGLVVNRDHSSVI